MSGLCDETQKCWDLAGATIEQITPSVFGNWVAKNLRRILRHPIGIIRDDPGNIVSVNYLHCFFRILRFKKFGGFNYSLNALMRASAHPRLPRPVTNRG